MVKRPIKPAPIRKLHVRKGDIVQVMTGNDKGKSGEIIDVDRKRARVTVKGINLHWKHLKKSQQHPQGGRIQRETSIHASNVLLFDAKAGRGVRVRHEVRDNKTVRVSVKSKEVLGAN